MSTKTNTGKNGTPKRGRYMFMCGTPKEHCIGSMCKTNHGLQDAVRAHGSPEAAFGCMKHYLLSQGYTTSGSRGFSAPNGGPTLVLTKKSRYGGRLRNGKEATRNQADRGGIIVG